jgi:hypothetical protein
MSAEGGSGHHPMDSWEQAHQAHAGKTGWASGGGWDLTPEETAEAMRVSGYGKDIDRRLGPLSLVIVGAGMKHIIETVNNHLDGRVAETYQDQPLAQDWARVAKLAEELGEMREASHGQNLSAADHERFGALEEAIGRSISALIGATGQNPRKGVTGTQGEMLSELVDVICTGLFALQHFTQDAEATADLVEAGMIKAHNRVTGYVAPAE